MAGWVDLAVLSNQLYGTSLDPTCKGATRHTFAIGNSALQRFVRGAEARRLFDLDSHAVQTIALDVLTFNKGHSEEPGYKADVL